jgi:hypothetical protein
MSNHDAGTEVALVAALVAGSAVRDGAAGSQGPRLGRWGLINRPCGLLMGHQTPPEKHPCLSRRR